MPTYSISGAPTAIEGGHLDFTITRDGDISDRAMVGFGMITSGAAANGGDIAVSNWAVFAAGSATGLLRVSAMRDNYFEDTETVTLTLTSASDGTIGAINSATGTIIDDGRAASVFSITGGNSIIEGGTLLYTVSRTGDVSKAASVDFLLTGTGGASDFTGTTGTASFSPGNSSLNIRVATRADNDADSAGTLQVHLTGIVSGQGSISADPNAASASGTIADDGTAVTSVTPSAGAPTTPPASQPTQPTVTQPPQPTSPTTTEVAAPIVGSGNSDVLHGQQWDDHVSGLEGDDLIYGGFGNDLVLGNQGSDTVTGNQGIDSVYGGQGNDLVYGGKDDDLVLGNQGEDTVTGNEGSDTVYGGLGNDLVFGGQGDDVVYGNQGRDTVHGGLGNDRLIGGEDVDLFQFGPGDGNGNDIIVDFNAAEGDRLNLAGQSYSVSEVGGSAVLALSGGGTITLLGVTAASLDAGAFV